MKSSGPSHFYGGKIQGQLKGTALFRSDWLRKKPPLLSRWQIPWHYSKARKPRLAQLARCDVPELCSWQAAQCRAAWGWGQLLEATHSTLPLCGWKRAVESAQRMNFFTAVPHPTSHCHPSTSTGFSECDKKLLTWAWGNARAKVLPRPYRSQTM